MAVLLIAAGFKADECPSLRDQRGAQLHRVHGNGAEWAFARGLGKHGNLSGHFTLSRVPARLSF